MKKKFTLFVLAVCLAMVCVIGFTACNITMPVDFEVQFIVDGEVYATIDTAGEETISLPENPQKDGFKFDGWYWDENTWERPFTANSLLDEKLTSDMRVYAKWKDTESEVQEYVVTFNSMGGSEIDSITVEEGVLLTKPTDPTYAGYIFNGWYKDEELQTEWNFATDTVTENITLYAEWIEESAAAGCEILSAEGFEIDGNRLSVKVPNSQNELSLSEAITVSPYAEWSVSSDITGEIEIPSATVSLAEGDNTYYINIVSGNGLYKKQYIVEIRRSAIYTVTYKFNNGDTDVTEKVEEDCKAPFKSAEKMGYTFRGWQNSGVDWDFENNLVVSDTTLTAVWSANSYDVTFDSNEDSTIGTLSVTYDSNFEFAVPVRDGYKFNGWKTEDGTLLTNSEGKGLAVWNIAQDTTLFADWSAVEYSITYYNVEGATNPNPVKYTVEDDGITLAEAQRTGYSFLGWYSDDSMITEVKQIDTLSAVNVELWAKWEIIEYTATFQNSDGVIETVTFTVEDKTLDEPEVPERNGYTGAWESYEIATNDLTIDAVYTPIIYTITYTNTKGVENGNETRYTIESEAIRLSDLSAEGYTFDGWYSDGEKVTEIASGTYGDITLEAKWTAIEYTITFIMENEDGGYDGHYADEENPETYTIEDEFTFISPVCDIRGYEFKGWYTQKQGSEKVDKILKGTTGDKIFYAKFTPCVYELWLDGNEETSYTVIFNVNGGSGNIPAQTVTEAAALTYPSQIPVKAGYIFAGWYDNSDCMGTGFDFSSAITADVTLYAKWIAEENTIININDGISIKIVGMTEYSYDFVPLVSGNVTIATTGLADTFGYLYNEQGVLLASDDDSGNGGINFQIVYNVTAGEKYTIKVRGYSEEMSGTAVLSIAGNAVPADGGVALEKKRVEIAFGSEFKLPVPTERIGYTFEGWFDVSGRQFTASDGVGLFAWDVAGDTVLYSKWSKGEFTVAFVTNNGSPVEAVTLSYGARLDLSQYVTTRRGYTFTGWYLNQTDAEPYNATTMPNTNLTLYAKWITYNLNNLKYDETKTAISVNDVLDAALFNAVCFDTDGKQVQVTVTASSEPIAGAMITVRLTATSNGKTTTKTITNVKVYGAPTLEYDTGKDYFNLSDTLDAELFSANGLDSFNEATEIRVFVEEENYVAGDLVTIVIQSIDPAGNITEQKIQNVKVYGLPEISYDQTVTGIKESDTIGAELFGVTGAVDSFGEPLDVTATLYNGTQEAGNIITVRLSAEDSKGNVCIIDLSIKVYGAPTINFPTNTDIKLGSEITAELLGLSGFDSHGGEVSFSLSTEDVQAAGEIMTYIATAADYLGNTASTSFSVKIYGQPTFSCREGINYNETPSVEALQARATDSFGKVLGVSVQLVSGTMTAGTKITVRLSATDASGTEWFVEKQIGVYDPEDIRLNYSAGMTDSIKLTSRGEEFDASAADSFGEACALSVRRADGGELIAGQVQDIVIIATDKAGNTKSSEIISSIKVYDMPTVELTDPGSGYIVQEGTDISFLFIVKDSFNQELYAEVTANSALVAGEIVCITVRATDSAGNVLEETFEFGVLPADYTLVSLFVEGKLWKTGFLTSDYIAVPGNPQGVPFYGWVDENNIRYTDESGQIFKELSMPNYIELYAIFCPTGYTPIFSIADLKNIQMSGKYALIYDIDLGGIEWTPLGRNEDSSFTGEFNGNGFTISNFKITTANNGYVGLFGYNKGIIKNLGVENFTISVEYSKTIYAGGLVAYNSGRIINSYATGNVDISASSAAGSVNFYAGGLVAYNSGSIINSYAMDNVGVSVYSPTGVSVYVYAGGLVGYNSGDITVCCAMGDVIATSSSGKFANAYAGGLVGRNDGTITNVYATGEVSATVSFTASTVTSGAYAGGLVGRNDDTITNGYSGGNVSAVSTSSSRYCHPYAGGLVGHNGGLAGNNSAVITNSYATGNVSAESFSSSANVGGLVGSNSQTIVNSYRYSGQIFTVKKDSSIFIEPTNTEGTAKDLITMQSVSFHTDTLGWSTDDWIFVEGSFPTLNM